MLRRHWRVFVALTAGVGLGAGLAVGWSRLPPAAPPAPEICSLELRKWRDKTAAVHYALAYRNAIPSAYLQVRRKDLADEVFIAVNRGGGRRSWSDAPPPPIPPSAFTGVVLLVSSQRRGGYDLIVAAPEDLYGADEMRPFFSSPVNMRFDSTPSAESLKLPGPEIVWGDRFQPVAWDMPQLVFDHTWKEEKGDEVRLRLWLKFEKYGRPDQVPRVAR